MIKVSLQHPSVIHKQDKPCLRPLKFWLLSGSQACYCTLLKYSALLAPKTLSVKFYCLDTFCEHSTSLCALQK